MPRCTCNNCVRCAGVPEWDARVTTMLSVWRGHWLWDHQTRIPHSLVGPTSQQNHASVWAPPFCWVFETVGPRPTQLQILDLKFFIPNWALWGLLFGPVGPTERNGWEWSSSREILKFFMSVSNTKSWHICPWVGLCFVTFVYGNTVILMIM